LINFFFYQKFDYKLQPLLLSLGGCLQEKNRQINRYNKQVSEELRINFREKI